MEKKINETIAPIVKKKLKEFKIRNNDDVESQTDRQRQDEIEFIEDTISINEFLSEYTDSYFNGDYNHGNELGRVYAIRYV